MYILLSNYNRPFAVIENITDEKITLAILEEYNYSEVSIIEKIKLPDWGETSTVDFTALDQDNFDYKGSVSIMKTVKY